MRATPKKAALRSRWLHPPIAAAAHPASTRPERFVGTPPLGSALPARQCRENAEGHENAPHHGEAPHYVDAPLREDAALQECAALGSKTRTVRRRPRCGARAVRAHRRRLTPYRPVRPGAAIQAVSR